MSDKPVRIMNIVGARPNMMKVAPLMAEMKIHREIDPLLVHTGQHYDYSMSQVFFDQLNHGTEPNYNLEVGPFRHAPLPRRRRSSGRFGELVAADRPDMVLVAGDVANSTIACAIVAAEEHIPVVPRPKRACTASTRSMPGNQSAAHRCHLRSALHAGRERQHEPGKGGNC